MMLHFYTRKGLKEHYITLLYPKGIKKLKITLNSALNYTL
jgi:hypothetical protein